MNRVILIGRLTREPEVRYSQGEKSTAVARFSLAVARRFKRENEPDCDFINCVAFGKTAEVIEKHVTKGTKIGVEGEWRTGSYTNRDGNKVYTNDCNVSSIEFCESKNASQSNQQSNGLPPMPSTDDFMQIPDGIENELPFN
ncbi:MAG: single-stranded DNA-binding protein [Clostridiales bacterium]|nr:single-stranded DNA-binding protein [Clostridiales bacterium]